jgi:hypothetical protein
MAVAMGGLALVVAARGGEEARRDAVSNESSGGDVVAGGDATAVAAPGGLAGGLSNLVSGRAIRLLDFEEIDQRGSACADALPDAPSTIRVSQGQSRLLDENMLVRLVVEGTAVYGDLDGDGNDEAAVHTVCEYGANGAQDQVQVWDLDADAARPRATLDRPPSGLGQGLPPTVKDVLIQGGELSVTWQSYSEDAPRCCPDQETTVRYEVDGGEVTQVGEPVTRTIG